MTPALDPTPLHRAYATARAALLAERTAAGHWVGELSTSALSTAVAVSALALIDPVTHASLIDRGLAWLASHQNADGGWGDTVKSFSNISTTMLCRSAYHLSKNAERYPQCLQKSAAWLAEHHGRTPAEIAEAVRRRYGKDRTFSVPILMTSALAGLVEWKEVPSLPFELACFPQSWYRYLGLPVVSYALPALIAIGQAVRHHRGSWNPIRWLAIRPSLRVLARIQPSNGGFLEATPLTSFVALGLASTGKKDHPVVRKCVEFIVSSVRDDGSWPIDTNLATWVTTLSVNALAAAGELHHLPERTEVRSFLRTQQYVSRHPFTGADPGAWAWTDLPGGVPDADDTPGALLALHNLAICDSPGITVVPDGVVGPGLLWLLGLQNRDGGWPTFCRGWGLLPFDRSGTDLTAHALRALHAWKPGVPFASFGDFARRLDAFAARKTLPDLNRRPLEQLTPERVARAMQAGLAYLEREQRPDGSWLPLWFGNQHAPDDVNPTYGTAKVLAAYRDRELLTSAPAKRGFAWLVANQNDDGGWGGRRGTPSSVEETALAVEVLLSHTSAQDAVARGLRWLTTAVEEGRLHDPTPIGFYFAKLWYFERMYPLAFTVAALGRAVRAGATLPPG